MRQWSLIITIGLLVILFCADMYAQTLFLKNGHLIDPKSRIIEQRHLLIENGIVQGYPEKLPVGFSGEVIDVTGRWIIPGLIDMHVHAYSNWAPKNNVQELDIEGSAKIMLYHGVTAFLDLASEEDAILDLRNRQRAGGFVAADIFSAGAAFTCTDGHGTQFGILPRIVDSPSDARREVTEFAGKNADVLKLIYDHQSANRPSVDRETMETVLQTAQAHKIKTVVHFGTWTDAMEVIKAGANVLTHTYSEPVPDELLDLMLQAKVFVIPTLTVHAAFNDYIQNPKLLTSPLLMSSVPAELIEAYMDTSGYSAFEHRWLNRQIASRQTFLSNVNRIARHGIKIMTGSDAGNLGTFQGYSLHHEMALLVESGLSTWEALEAATTTPSEFLDISVGLNARNQANLLVLSASPIENIRNTEKIELVVHHGRVIDRKKLLQVTNSVIKQ